MSIITKLALVISVMGAFATWLFLVPLGPLGLQIWAAFIAWGCFYHCGANAEAFRQSVAGGLWGAFMATVALVAISKIGSDPISVSAIVGITVAIFILGAHIPLLSVIPAAVYGYSAAAAFALLKTGTDPLSLDISISPFLNIGASLIIGGILGYVSKTIVDAMGAEVQA